MVIDPEYAERTDSLALGTISCVDADQIYASSLHRDLHTLLIRTLLRNLIPRIRMPKNPHHRVIRQYAFQAFIRFLGPVADDNLPRVLGEADADAPAVVEADPAGPADGVDGEVQEGPVADGIAAVEHAFGFAVGGGDGAAIEVVAADDDGGGDLTLPHHLVELQPRPVPLAEAQPADAAGQPLTSTTNSLLGLANPAMQ